MRAGSLEVGAMELTRVGGEVPVHAAVGLAGRFFFLKRTVQVLEQWKYADGSVTWRRGTP